MDEPETNLEIQLAGCNLKRISFDESIMDELKTKLEQQLADCSLKMISFDESAMKKLYSSSEGDWRDAKLFAGAAVLEALATGNRIITGAHIGKADVRYSLGLYVKGGDVWDLIKSLGQHAHISPSSSTSVQSNMLTHQFDVDVLYDARKAISEHRLPQYVLTDKIEYTERQAVIPFEYIVSKEEVYAVASNLAYFVTKHTSVPHHARDISLRNSWKGIQYFVEPVENDVLSVPSYKVSEPKFFKDINGALGVVIIEQEMLCEQDVLAGYVKSVKEK